MLSKKTCEICHDLSDVINVDSSRIVHASKEWRIVATLGPLSDFHLMLVPAEHRHFSIGNNNDIAFITRVMKIWSTFVGDRTPLVFEHANSETGCGIVHAHIHLFAEFKKLSIKNLFSDLPITPIQSIEVLALERKELFWCANSLDKFFAVVGQKIPSQYARSRIASEFRLEFSSDWKTYTHPELLRANVRLAKEFVCQLRE